MELRSKPRVSPVPGLTPKRERRDMAKYLVLYTSSESAEDMMAKATPEDQEAGVEDLVKLGRRRPGTRSWTSARRCSPPRSSATRPPRTASRATPSSRATGIPPWASSSRGTRTCRSSGPDPGARAVRDPRDVTTGELPAGRVARPVAPLRAVRSHRAAWNLRRICGVLEACAHSPSSPPPSPSRSR